jgi:hypothetical protein
MAYRKKGFLTKKEREDAESFLLSYGDLLSNQEVPDTLRDVAQCAYYPFVLLVRAALEADTVAMMNRAVAGKGGNYGCNNR